MKAMTLLLFLLHTFCMTTYIYFWSYNRLQTRNWQCVYAFRKIKTETICHNDKCIQITLCAEIGKQPEIQYLDSVFIFGSTHSFAFSHLIYHLFVNGVLNALSFQFILIRKRPCKALNLSRKLFQPKTKSLSNIAYCSNDKYSF